jgi:phospholipid/cholesterol/gamma-HCH transport system substrate-binding protein
MREARVGVVMLAGLAGMVGVLVMANGGPGYLVSRRHVDVVFRDGQGIRVGSPVRVAGIDAGRVHAVDLTELEGALRARVRMALPADLAGKLKQDAKITIQAGLTGQSYVNIISSGRSSVALVPGQVLQGVETTMFDPILEQVGLGPVERSHLSHTIGEVRQTVDAVGPRLRLILASLQDTATNLRETSATVRPAILAASNRVEEVAKRVDPAKIEDTLNRLNAMVAHADGLFADARPNLLATIENVKNLSATLQDMSVKSRPKIDSLLDGINLTRARMDQTLAQVGTIAKQGAEFMTHNRANLERTTLNVRDASDYGKKLVQKLYGNPFYLSPFYKPTKEDIRAQEVYDAANTFMNGAQELRDTVKTLQALRDKPTLTAQERDAYVQLYNKAWNLDLELQRTAGQLIEGLRASIRR